MKENTRKDIYEQRLKLYKALSETVSLNTHSKIAKLIANIWENGKTMKERIMMEDFAEKVNHLLEMNLTEKELLQKATEIQKKILKEVSSN